MRSFVRFVIVAANVATFCFGASALVAADAPAVSRALSPQESLKQIVIEPGLKVELVAHEPNIQSPVAIRFDEDGRLWVVEMRDYPSGSTKDAPGKSRISVLRDKDGDGFYETATVFADNLSFATGVQPWKGGVFVTLSGQVAYMKDTNGDDKADVAEKWYAGFAQGNQQLRANHPTLALDNHIYIAAGLRGGRISDPAQPDIAPVSISGRDFRFDPLTRKFEAATGAAQFGLTFDDYGNRLCCANRDPAIHVVLEDRDLKKNPLVTVDSVLQNVVYGASRTPIFPIGRAWVTSNLHEGEFTSACAVEIYRGDLLPEEYYNNVFTCEPTSYMIHREIMKPRGTTFAGHRAHEGSEFFASRDEWCRPVNLEVGPEGAMYVVDMYRQIIEHPEWMPEELRKRPNMRAGYDMGRIYRIVPNDFQRPAAVKLSGMNTKALVNALADKNSWQRETASRLLLERQDRSIVPQLRRLALESDLTPTRVAALRLMEGLGVSDDQLLLRLCDDPDPRVVEQAVIASESRVEKSSKLRERIAKLAEHADARVRFRALVAATALPPVPKREADKWEVTAMLIAAGKRGGTVLAKMLEQSDKVEKNVDEPARFFSRLARLAAASKDEREQAKAVAALVANAEYGEAGLVGFLAESTRDGTTLDNVRGKLDKNIVAKVDQAIAAAKAAATATDRTDAVRCEAIDLVAFANDAAAVLTPLAEADKSQAVRLRAIAALSTNKDVAPWKQLLAQFLGQTPAVQRAILDGLFASVERTSLLLDEIAAGRIKPAVIDPIHAKMLLTHKDAAIKKRAEKVMASAVPADREKVLSQYRSVLTMDAEPSRGRAIFERRCAICHQIGNVGVKFAPDISDSREKTPEQILTDIIQPNRAIDNNYFSYTATTTDGRVHTGVLAAETATSVTLKQQEGKSETLRRDEIETLHNDGVSYMPEGLEKDIPPQDMADLISFIKNWRYFDNPQGLPGGAVVKPQADN
jgi:putative membrane-bound dehydrogenase-like protein